MSFEKMKKGVVSLYKRVFEHDVMGMATQLSYFFLLSLFPLLIAIFSLLPFTPLESKDILHFLDDFAPKGTIGFIEQNINDIMSRHDINILSVSVLGTLWAASNGMNGIIIAINRAYEVKDDRHFLIVRALSIVMTIVMIIVIIVALLLSVFGRHLGIVFFSHFGMKEEFLHMWETLRWVLSGLILLVVFSTIYVLTPNKKLKCVAILPGAIFSTLGWMIVSYGFSFYVNHFGRYSLMYGSIGVVIILMAWFYFTALILIIGGEINAIKEALSGCNEKPG